MLQKSELNSSKSFPQFLHLTFIGIYNPHIFFVLSLSSDALRFVSPCDMSFEILLPIKFPSCCWCNKTTLKRTICLPYHIWHSATYGTTLVLTHLEVGDLKMDKNQYRSWPYPKYYQLVDFVLLWINWSVCEILVLC